MLILIVTLIAHLLFTITDAYWLFAWLDMPVHFFLAAGLAIVFVRHLKWGRSLSIVAVLCMAIGWEFAERAFGFAQALAESIDDASTDVIAGVIGGIIGSNYAKER